MSSTEYPACIHELYQSEVLGEKAFLALVNIAKNAREKYHIATVLQLETETKARLRPFLLKHGYELVEEAGDELVGEIVAAYQGNSWLEFLTGLSPLVDQFLGRFEEIAAAGPAEDQEVLQSMITHEASFVSWIEKEIAGEEGSLDAIISQLKYPFPAP
ncbi:MAG: hypothetical protein V7754_02895 [Halioglobus sp.]